MLALGLEFGFYHFMLRGPLRTRDIATIRPAINRWLLVTIAWQVLLIAGCVAYLVVLGSGHGRSSAWIAPPVGAAFGLAVPLNFIAMAILRAVRSAY